MKDFRNCGNEAYNYAMSKEAANCALETIPTNVIYILYTKYKSDSVRFSSSDRGDIAKKKKQLYWNELYKRKTS